MNGIWQGGEFVLQSTIEERLARVTAERDRLLEALTPTADTKAAYMGEFRMTIPDVGDDGAEYMRTVNIPWTTVKEIMQAIRNRAALQEAGDE